MQFTTLAATVALGVTLAAATPTNTIPASQCSTGDLQCCNSSGTANSAAVAPLLALLGIVVQDVSALVGVTCSPITAVGVGGNSCSAQPVCKIIDGVVALGCTPVNLNL